MKSANTSAVIFISLTISLTVIGQLLVKKGMMVVGSAPSDVRSLPLYIWNAVTNPVVFGSLACAVLAAFSWMAAVSRCDLSFAYPFMSLAIVLTMTMNSVVLGEKIHPHQWLGVVIVALGIWVTSRPA